MTKARDKQVRVKTSSIRSGRRRTRTIVVICAVGHLQRRGTLCGSVPDGPELCLAELYLQQDRLGDAEAHFRHVLEQDADNARAHLGLGRLAYERGNLQDALSHLNRCAANKRT